MQAAEAGLPEAMYHLGVAYVHGQGVRRQDNAAAKWWGCVQVESSCGLCTS